MMERETDYEQEAENLRMAGSAFSEEEGIVVPRVFPEFSTRRVLTMEYIDGVHLDRFLASKPSQTLRDQFGHKISLSVLRLDHGKRLMYADPQPGNYLFMPDGRLGFIDFGCCSHHSDEFLECLVDAERAYLEAPEDLRDVIARINELTPKQAGDDARMELLVRFVHWAWEPIVHEGPFDFSDPDYFRRGVELYGDTLRRRYTRSQPPNTCLIKCMYGLRAMLNRLEARVDIGSIYRTERSRGSRQPRKPAPPSA